MGEHPRKGGLVAQEIQIWMGITHSEDAARNVYHGISQTKRFRNNCCSEMWFYFIRRFDKYRAVIA